MSEKLKIRVTIGDRIYPLTINLKEEEGVRKAVSRINDLSKKFENSYAVQDKQDVLAMCALQFASQVEVKNVADQLGMKNVEDKLKEINSILDSHLE
ncbi:MAG TPA: cell division protein ZapA [Flavobacteriaceae bacterium]|nr:cell division protein ZapA [Flavobacteriaceae bacterium]